MRLSSQAINAQVSLELDCSSSRRSLRLFGEERRASEEALVFGCAARRAAAWALRSRVWGQGLGSPFWAVGSVRALGCWVWGPTAAAAATATATATAVAPPNLQAAAAKAARLPKSFRSAPPGPRGGTPAMAAAFKARSACISEGQGESIPTCDQQTPGVNKIWSKMQRPFMRTSPIGDRKQFSDVHDLFIHQGD